MMTRTNMLHARVGAAAIAAVLALSSTNLVAAPTPVVDLSSSPAETGQSVTAPAPEKSDNVLPIMGGGALILVLGGVVAIAAARRRRDRQPVLDYRVVDESAEPAASHRAPVRHDEPAMSGPSAFAWGGRTAADVPTRTRAETWVERAYRGPSPDNPSLSLRKRLKRAAFFDQREREAAAGKAQPVDADAGLPEHMTETVHEREREAA
jgi:hypothetical protein